MATEEITKTQSETEKTDSVSKEERTRRVYVKKNLNRLRFIEVLIQESGLTWSKLAKMSNGEFSAQHFAYWREKDNTFLSNVKEVGKLMGFAIKPVIYYQGKDEVFRREQELSENVEVKYPVFEKKKGGGRTKLLADCAADESKNLYFLADYVTRNFDSLSDFSRKIGKSITAIRYWFEQDDILVSNLGDIAKSCKVRLVWDISFIREED